MERMVFLFSSWDMRFDPAMVAIALFLVWFVVAAGVVRLFAFLVDHLAICRERAGRASFST